MVFALVAAAAVAAQTSTSNWGGFTPRPTIAFQCQQLPLITGEGSQSYRLECWSNDIPVGRTAEGLFNWTAGMTPATRIKAVELTLVGHPVDIAEGTDYLFLSGSFTAGRTTLPACAAQTRFALTFGQTVTTPLTFAKPWKGPSSSSSSSDAGSQHKPSCSGPKLRALDAADGSSARSAAGDATVQTWRPGNRIPTTPDGLRLRLTCQPRSAGKVCSAMVRLEVRFSNSSLPDDVNAFERLSRDMEAKEGFKCADRSWMDATGLLGLKGEKINTDVCYPPAAPKSTGTSAQLQAGGAPVAQTLDMAPVLAYDTRIITKATRLARYASAIHGCLPSTPGSPQTYKAADGSTKLRQWNGTAGMSSWGGPGTNGQPGPECVSCFKEGIDFSDTPKGYQTPENSLSNPTSFLDAAIVFTDTAISGVAGQSAVVVLFRATASSISSAQWISNIGFCVIDSGNQIAPSNDAASGQVCNGWNTPVEDLIALGLQAEVLRRLEKLPAADRTVYITGHSRGGALAAVFAAKLLALQASGALPAYSGAAEDRVKLYTYGSPCVGDTFFAAYLENNMRERYRIMTRYDAVPTFPSESSTYSHFRPSIWYRDSSDNIAPYPNKGCVLFNQDQLTSNQRGCFLSCNSVLTCSYGAGVDISNQPTVSGFTTVATCTDLSDFQIRALSGTTLAGSTTLIDHASYLGLDMNNNGCRADVGFIDAYTISDCGFLGCTCTAL